jgi:serine/threonine protein kinase
MAMHCPQCGTDLPAAGSSPLDLCPKCLLSAALSADSRSCPYHIVAPIAESRTGTTYLAQPVGTRGIVALKVFVDRDDVDEALDRYERVKPALARLKHGSVARLVDVGVTDDGLLYLASQFVAGWQLSAIDEHKSVDTKGRVEIARQLTSAVGAIHTAGLAHLAIDAAHIRVSTAAGVHATILGLGARIVVDGADPVPAPDREAVAAVIRRLGVPQ